MKVGFDLDGVLYPFDQALAEYFLDRGTRPEALPTPQSWHFYKDWGLKADGFDYTCHEATRYGDLFNCLPPYPGAADAVRKVKAAGHSIHIITARNYGNPGQAQSQTVKWLNRYGIPYDTLTFSSDKTIVTTDVYLDDKISNVESFKDTKTTGILLRRSWNNDCPPGMLVATCVSGYADYVLGL